jgi:hypothetical protein
MKIAVMQPYIFPYIGYFQLINAVDKFVFYDDVNYIKGGWINRNNILLNGKKNLFTIPLKNASSFQTINETEIHTQLYQIWVKKFLRSIEQSYKKAHNFDEIYHLIKKVFEINYKYISDLCIYSVELISNYLALNVGFEKSSEKYSNSKGFDKADRLINICQLNEVNTYINPSGGKELYQKETFKEHNIDLLFIENIITFYPQFNNDFVPTLSIIDVLMFNSKEAVIEMLNQYKLV